MPQLRRDIDFTDDFVEETARTWMQNLDLCMGVTEDELDDSLYIRHFIEDRLERVMDALYDKLFFSKQFYKPRTLPQQSDSSEHSSD